MNAEQLKQLKPGDEIFIRAKYEELAEDGDVWFSHSATNVFNGVVETVGYTHHQNIILPSELQPAPKYDPCRKFRKGDKVEYYPRNGRDFFDMPWIYDAAVVIEDEYRSGTVVVRFTFNYGEPSVHKVPWYHLQLVTPVEELEPYIIKEYVDFYAVEKDGAQYSIFFKGSYHTKAKEAAEAERDRLNAEYRKGEK